MLDHIFINNYIYFELKKNNKKTEPQPDDSGDITQMWLKLILVWFKNKHDLEIEEEIWSIFKCNHISRKRNENSLEFLHLHKAPLYI